MRFKFYFIAVRDRQWYSWLAKSKQFALISISNGEIKLASKNFLVELTLKYADVNRGDVIYSA